MYDLAMIDGVTGQSDQRRSRRLGSPDSETAEPSSRIPGVSLPLPIRVIRPRPLPPPTFTLFHPVGIAHARFAAETARFLPLEELSEGSFAMKAIRLD